MIQRDLVRRIEVGFRTEPRRDTLERALARDLTLAGPRFPVPPAGTTGFWFQKERVPDEALLLTGDENIIEIGFTAQYRVQDPVAFAYTVADPESVVRNVTMAALRATRAIPSRKELSKTPVTEPARFRSLPGQISPTCCVPIRTV